MWIVVYNFAFVLKSSLIWTDNDATTLLHFLIVPWIWMQTQHEVTFTLRFSGFCI